MNFSKFVRKLRVCIDAALLLELTENGIFVSEVLVRPPLRSSAATGYDATSPTRCS